MDTFDLIMERRRQREEKRQQEAEDAKQRRANTEKLIWWHQARQLAGLFLTMAVFGAVFYFLRS
jgi:hypothetical protein